MYLNWGMVGGLVQFRGIQRASSEEHGEPNDRGPPPAVTLLDITTDF